MIAKRLQETKKKKKKTSSKGPDASPAKPWAGQVNMIEYVHQSFLGGLRLAKNKPSMSLMEIGFMYSNSSKLRNVRLGGRLCAVAKSFAGVA